MFLSYYMLVPSSDWQPMIQSMDLRRLCSTILAKTIADPDMYQNGLTKIFFRAGMLAALESFRSDRLNAMVTVVQKNVRRILAVKRYRDLRSATIKLQTWWRGILARRFVEGIRREVSAMRLQTAIRRFLQRKQFLDVRFGIILFQSRTRPFVCFTLTSADLKFLQVCVAFRAEIDTLRRNAVVLLPFSRVSFAACTFSCTY
jgi:myosin-5